MFVCSGSGAECADALSVADQLRAALEQEVQAAQAAQREAQEARWVRCSKPWIHTLRVTLGVMTAVSACAVLHKPSSGREFLQQQRRCLHSAHTLLMFAHSIVVCHRWAVANAFGCLVQASTEEAPGDLAGKHRGHAATV